MTKRECRESPASSQFVDGAANARSCEFDEARGVQKSWFFVRLLGQFRSSFELHLG